jgi:hypothetical protein
VFLKVVACLECGTTAFIEYAITKPQHLFLEVALELVSWWDTSSNGVGLRAQILIASILLLLLPGCKHATEPSGPSRVDTTSHNFTWTTYTLGGASSSSFSDVAIINDTLIYATGEVYQYDSTGQLDPYPYCIAQWNGVEWKLRRLYDVENVKQLLPEMRGLNFVGPDDIWLTSGSVFHWDGVSDTEVMKFSRLSLSS